MDPGALGNGVALDCEVLGDRLARGDVAGRVQSHGLLQACVQVRHARQFSRSYSSAPTNAINLLRCSLFNVKL